MEDLLKQLPRWHVQIDGQSAGQVDDTELNNMVDAKSTQPWPTIRYSLDLETYQGPWKVIVPMTPLKRDTLHEFQVPRIKASFLVILGLPDGGIHRFGVYGSIE
jgi:hypothetical protein